MQQRLSVEVVEFFSQVAVEGEKFMSYTGYEKYINCAIN